MTGFKVLMVVLALIGGCTLAFSGLSGAGETLFGLILVGAAIAGGMYAFYRD